MTAAIDLGRRGRLLRGSRAVVDTPPFDLAEHVVQLARSLNIETALIGSIALAVHGFERGSPDIDLACCVGESELTRLRDALDREGRRTAFDPRRQDERLRGVLRVWVAEHDGEPIEPVEVLHFAQSATTLPVHELVRDATSLVEIPALRCVRLPDLILLKLYSRRRSDQADIVAMLERNKHADLAEIRASCERYGYEVIDTLIAEAEHDRAQHA